MTNFTCYSVWSFIESFGMVLFMVFAFILLLAPRDYRPAHIRVLFDAYFKSVLSCFLRKLSDAMDADIGLELNLLFT